VTKPCDLRSIDTGLRVRFTSLTAIEAVSTDTRCGSCANRHADSFKCIGTDLEALRAESAVENLATTETSGFGNTIQLLLQLRHFALQSSALGGAVRTVGGLQGQVTHTLQNAGGLLQSTFSSLRQGD